jgi:ABC-type amino acid transport substrate-binding protein
MTRCPLLLSALAAAGLLSACATTDIRPGRQASIVAAPLSAPSAPRRMPAVPPLTVEEASESPLLRYGLVEPRERPSPTVAQIAPQPASPADQSPDPVGAEAPAADLTAPALQVEAATSEIAIDASELHPVTIVAAAFAAPQLDWPLIDRQYLADVEDVLAEVPTADAAPPASPVARTDTKPHLNSIDSALAALNDTVPEAALQAQASAPPKPLALAFNGAPRRRPESHRARLAEGGPEIPVLFQLRR